jgi:hypothetical protein
MNIKLDRAYVGSCTGGKTSDFVEFARVLRGKNVVIDTFGVPATPEIARDLQTTYWGNQTIWEILVAAGVQMTENAGCAACLGGPVDTFGRINKSGIKCISATNRNFPGRMGDKESQVFLASPATVAASALTGKSPIRASIWSILRVLKHALRFDETIQLGDKRLRPAFEIASLPAQNPAVRVQQHIGGKALNAEEFLHRNICPLKVIALRLVLRKIHRDQDELVLGIAGETVGGQDIVVKLEAPHAPVGTGEREQHMFVFRLRLPQGAGQPLAPGEFRGGRGFGSGGGRGAIGRRDRMNRRRFQQLVVICGLIRGLLELGGARLFGIEVEMLLPLGRKRLDFYVGHAAGVREKNIRGADAGNGDVAVGVGADLQHGDFFAGARGENQHGQQQGVNEFSVHGGVVPLHSRKVNRKPGAVARFK